MEKPIAKQYSVEMSSLLSSNHAFLSERDFYFKNEPPGVNYVIEICALFAFPLSI